MNPFAYRSARTTCIATMVVLGCASCVATEDELSLDWLEESAPIVLGKIVSLDFACDDLADEDWETITGEEVPFNDTDFSLPRAIRGYRLTIDTVYQHYTQPLGRLDEALILLREVVEREPRTDSEGNTGFTLGGALEFTARTGQQSESRRRLREVCSRVQDVSVRGFVPSVKRIFWRGEDSTLCFGGHTISEAVCFDESAFAEEAKLRGIERFSY